MKKNTKERILLAGVREFAKNGFHATTVRSIVDRAEVKNLNSIVYYYGGKEGLYKAVLDFMFSEAEKFKEVDENNYTIMSTEDKIASMIRFLCRAYYSVDTQLDQDLYNIFIKEAANPTPFFDEIVALHLRPVKVLMCSLLREYLGPEVSQNVIENCEYSISSQILYGAVGWSILTRVAPDQKHFRESIEELSSHIINFTLSGIRGLKQ